PGINGIVIIEKIKIRNIIGQSQIGFKKRIYISDVGPVTVVLIADYFIFSEGLRQDLFSKIRRGYIFILQQILQQLAVKDIDAHGSEVMSSLGLHYRPGITYPVFVNFLFGF